MLAGLGIAAIIAIALACYGIAGLLSSLFGFDIIITCMILVASVIVIGGLAIYILFFVKEMEIPETLIGSLVIVIIVFDIIGIFYMINQPYSEEEIEEAGKWRTCSERTNTYYKCSWSFKEDRCVCKQR